MRTKLFTKDFEEEARAWCVALGLDPDDRVTYPDPDGYAVCRRRARWVEYAVRLHNNWIESSLVSRALKRLGVMPVY